MSSENTLSCPDLSLKQLSHLRIGKGVSLLLSEVEMKFLT